LLRLLTGDPPELAARALEVFRAAEEGGYTLTSFDQVERTEAAGAILNLLDRDGIQLEDEGDLRPALEAAGIGELATFDKGLRRCAKFTLLPTPG